MKINPVDFEHYIFDKNWFMHNNFILLHIIILFRLITSVDDISSV